jgi:cysteine desulfurase
MNEDEFRHVVFDMRLPTGAPFPLPVILDISTQDAIRLRGVSRVSLVFDGSEVGSLDPQSIYTCDKQEVANKLYGTADSSHPGVEFFMRGGDHFVGGPVELTRRVKLDVSASELTPDETRAEFARRGWKTTLLPVGATGIVEPQALEDALTDGTAIVSVMHANNEIGTIQPVAELARIAHSRGALFHTDAVQTVAKIPVNVRAMGADLLSLSAHKFNGPKGAGALWIKRGTRIAPILTGGKHERTRRAGTENVPGIAGLGAAAGVAQKKLTAEGARVGILRDRLEREILERVPGTEVNGARETRVPNTSNISFDRVEAESLLIALDLEGIAVSTGAACSSGTLEPSHVLRAMGLPTQRAQNSIRFSLGAGNTDAEIDYLLEKLPRAVEKLRSLTGARR